MSNDSQKAKIDFILEMSGNIKNIVKRHGGVTKALEDYEGQMAILMGISQIGETLKKLDDEIVKKCDLQEDKEGAYYTRNYIVHDYEGVDFALIENIVRVYLPELENKIVKFTEEIDNEKDK